MDDTVLRVAATLWGEAGMCGLAGLYAAAYAIACRMEHHAWLATWEEMLSGTGPFRPIGGWSWYQKAAREGTLEAAMQEIADAAEYASHEQAQGRHVTVPTYELARLLVWAEATPAQIARFAEDDTGLQLAGELLYCMSQTDVDNNHWPEGDVVVYGPKPYALHLYAEWPANGVKRGK